MQDTSQKMILGLFIFMLILIPTGSYLVVKRTSVENSNSAPDKRGDVTSVVNKAKSASSSANPLDELRRQTEKAASASSTKTPEVGSNIAVSFGPTMTIHITIEGRPANNQSAKKVFLGIATGTPTGAPTSYLLSFSLDFPSSGTFEGLSLAGLDTGQTYTAYVKSPGQIATSSAFLMTPTTVQLNSGKPLFLTSGDLNEDNVVDMHDYDLAKAAYGSNPNSANWNDWADFNLDSIINSIDLGVIMRNLDKKGASGAWISTPKVSTSSATPATGSAQPAGGPPAGGPNGKGYWLWVPSL
jgi:hypothetical protein